MSWQCPSKIVIQQLSETEVGQRMVPAGLFSGRSPTRLMQKRFQIIRQISGGVEGMLVSIGNLPEEILGSLEVREMQWRFCVHEIMCGR
jgi:hypothetical protein